MAETRKPGGGRKPSKPGYCADKNLTQQMDAATALYGQYTKELWIDRRENSKSLAWSSVLLALNNIKEVGAVVDRPKALGDIRGVTYIYGMFYRFGLIDMPDKVNGKMKRAGRQM